MSLEKQIKILLELLGGNLKIVKAKTKKSYYNLLLSNKYGDKFLTTGSLLHCIKVSKAIYSTKGYKNV